MQNFVLGCYTIPSPGTLFPCFPTGFFEGFNEAKGCYLQIGMGASSLWES